MTQRNHRKVVLSLFFICSIIFWGHSAIETWRRWMWMRPRRKPKTMIHFHSIRVDLKPDYCAHESRILAATLKSVIRRIWLLTEFFLTSANISKNILRLRFREEGWVLLLLCCGPFCLARFTVVREFAFEWRAISCWQTTLHGISGTKNKTGIRKQKTKKSLTQFYPFAIPK